MKYLNPIAIILLVLIHSIGFGQETLTNAQLKDSITNILIQSKTPCAFITVINDDRVLFQYEYGVVDSLQKKPISKENIFALGSISKTFTALAIMKLVDEGKLNLDDHLKNVLPKFDFTNKWEETHPVKIKHLLSHRAGFDDMHIADIIKKRDADYYSSLEEVLTFKKSYRTYWKPGLVFSYSNPGYILLGHIVEKVSGVSYQKYIKNHILLPLQMNHTTYFSTNSTKNLVTGFQKSGKDIIRSKTPKLIGESAGGMYSNATDMAKLLQFFISQKTQDSIEIIAPQLLDEMMQLQSDFERNINLIEGYSIGMYDRYYGTNEVNFKGHNGLIDGFSSDYIFNRNLNIGIASSQSLFGKSNRPIIDLLVDHFVAASKSKDISSSNSTDISKFMEWEGTYKMLNGTNLLVDFINAPFRTLHLKLDNDKVIAKPFLGKGETYFQVEKNIFKTKDENLASLFLGTFDQDKTIVYGEDTFIKINPLSYYFRLLLLSLGLISGLILTVLFIVQLIVFPFKKTVFKSLKTTLLIVLPFWLIFGSIFLYLGNASYLNLSTLGTVTTTSVSLFLSSLLFSTSSIYGIYKLYKNQFYYKNTKARFFYNFTFLSITFLSFYCLDYGWFAVRLWSY